MGATILEVAKACGTSKTSVRRALDKLELWGTSHVDKGNGGVYRLDAYAAAAVADALGKSQDAVSGDSGNCAANDNAALVHALERHIDSLERQLDVKDNQITELMAKVDSLTADLVEANRRAVVHRGFWQRLLGSGED